MLRTLPEINVNASLFGTIEYVIDTQNVIFWEKQRYFYLLFGTKQTHGVDHDHSKFFRRYVLTDPC